MKFEVPGVPVAKGRPRFENGHVRTPTKTVEYEDFVKLCFYKAGGQITEHPVRMMIDAYYPVPKGTPSKKAAAMMDGRIKRTARPDVDNIGKIVLDALNGLAYVDDKQVIELQVRKHWGNPRCVVEVI